MSILTNSGRAALATAVKNNPLHLAWGRGDPTWDADTPRESRAAIALTAEIGRRLANIVQYALPADDGDIVVLGGRYKASASPTPHLHLRTQFEFDDGLGETIRELGIFIGTQPRSGLPPGQQYFLPGDLSHPGTLLALDHITGIARGVGSRIAFDFVITF